MSKFYSERNDEYLESSSRRGSLSNCVTNLPCSSVFLGLLLLAFELVHGTIDAQYEGGLPRYDFSAEH